jgi:hypothetical protein
LILGWERRWKIYLFEGNLVMKLWVHLIGWLLNFLETVLKVLQLEPDIVTKALVIEPKSNWNYSTKQALESYIPGALDTETGVCLTGASLRWALGGLGGSCPWLSVGGGAVLYVGDITEILGDKDGTCPWKIKGGVVTTGGLGECDGTSPVIVWGTGADVIGGNASGEGTCDPVFSNQKYHKMISGLVTVYSDSLC